MKLKISVVIPAYNAEKTIGKTLNATLSQNFPKNRYEIIVVDDGSDDDTRQIIKKFRRVRLLKQKHKGPAVARNLGVKYAKGEIVLFTDADCIPDKNWIKKIIEPFKNKNIVGVAGTYVTLNKDKFFARFTGYEIEQRHENMKKFDSINFVGSYNCAYRKSVFMEFEGFDKSFLIASGEDPELSFRIEKIGHYKIVFQPKAIVFHSHPENIKTYFKQKYNRAFWKVLLYKKHPSKVFGDKYTPRTLFPQILFTGLGMIIFFSSFFHLKIFNISLLFILISLLFNYKFYLFVWKRDKTVALLSPFIFFLRNVISIFAIFHSSLYFIYKKINIYSNK